MFSNISEEETINNNILNDVLKNLYSSDFFEEVSLNFNDNILTINVKENAIIQNIYYEGIKAKRVVKLIKDNTKLKSRSSYNELYLKNDKKNIQSLLKDLGYYFPSINILKEKLNNNSINITYDIDLGEKAKISKISFIGDKKFKDKKLKSIIVSEENKFWKFITNKKYVNESIINLDKRLLKNFYLNRGFYDVKIDTSFAKLINQKDFELIYNIQANKKFFFNDLKIELPKDFEENNFVEIFELFKNLKGEPYSINQIENILEKLDAITLREQNQSISANVEENIVDQAINLNFIIK